MNGVQRPRANDRREFTAESSDSTKSTAPLN
jgi:hypothetical protein